jgi:hypothetical protein
MFRFLDLLPAPRASVVKIGFPITGSPDVPIT